MCVDWLKYIFLAKFNRIPPKSFAQYHNVLIADVLLARLPACAASLPKFEYSTHWIYGDAHRDPHQLQVLAFLILPALLLLMLFTRSPPFAAAAAVAAVQQQQQQQELLHLLPIFHVLPVVASSLAFSFFCDVCLGDLALPLGAQGWGVWAAWSVSAGWAVFELVPCACNEPAAAAAVAAPAAAAAQVLLSLVLVAFAIKRRACLGGIEEKFTQILAQ
ncbi:hypothetical protein Emed_002275 [Eimeria media]